MPSHKVLLCLYWFLCNSNLRNYVTWHNQS